jgi:hypothetical protein
MHGDNTMDWLPKENGARLVVPNTPDNRLALEAYNFHVEHGDGQHLTMIRIGPDNVVLAGAEDVRRQLPAAFIARLKRDVVVL